MRALIANNSFHHLDHGPWRARFPKAESYAAPQALARLKKRAASIPFRSLDELSLPPAVKFHVLPGFKNGKERMTALLAEDPPAIIVPAHGPAVMTAQLVAEAKTQIARL